MALHPGFEGDKFKLAIDQSLKDKVMQKLSDELTWLKGHGLDFEINSKDLLFRNDAYEKYLKKSNIVDKAHDELTQNENKKIFVTQPILPDIEIFSKGLKKIWDKKYLVMVGLMHNY